MGVFSFLFFFFLNCFWSPPSCNVNREKSSTSKYQLGFHPNWWQHESGWKKKIKKRHLECFCSSVRILAVLLIGAWVCITICMSKLDITVKARSFVVQPLTPISPPTSPQAFEQPRSGTLKSGVESVWHGKGSLKVLLFEPFLFKVPLKVQAGQ